ncbi:g9340 [Coccomyxa viridis]|uniref:G9340 protein n=1 Tax=Coccomyxa viridis TaxID=1274662 RepID=A0ABP1G2N5_9CHLO
MSQRILVTGAAGFVGANFVRYVLDEHPGTTVVGIDNLSTGFRHQVDERAIFHEIDLTNHVALEQVFATGKFDAIVHMAAFAAECLSPFVRRHCYMSNVIASTNLINAAINHDVPRFVFMSSIASYGDCEPPFREDATPVHNDIYGLTKYVTEQDLKIAAAQHGLDYVVLKPFNIYGPLQALDSRYRNVAGIFMQKILTDQPLTLYGDGQQTRAFTYIDDILPPIWRAVSDKSIRNEVFNLGSSSFHTVEEVADCIMQITGRGEKKFLEARHEVRHAYCDVSKAERLLGLAANTDLATGLGKMWDWARRETLKPVESFGELEVTKGLYGFWK